MSGSGRVRKPSTVLTAYSGKVRDERCSFIDNFISSLEFIY